MPRRASARTTPPPSAPARPADRSPHGAPPARQRPAPRLARLVRATAACLLLGLLGPASLALAAGGDGLVLPRSEATVEDGAVRLSVHGAQTSYVSGLGWLSGWTFPAPVVRDDGRVLVAPEVADALGLAHLAGVRTGLNGSTTRIVLDLPHASAAAIEGTRTAATLRAGEERVLALPGVLVPDGVLLEREGLTVRALPADGDGPARVVVSGPAADLDVFPLQDPARVVVDLGPPLPGGARAARETGPDAAAGAAAAPLAPVPGSTAGDAADLPAVAAEQATSVAPGVTYRTLRAPGAAGPSEVHVVELDPALTELRVVGRSGEGRPVADWADGGVAAINAGYFDPADFSAIGLRRIGGTLLSLPSRGRAAVGFGAGGTVVSRADARVRVRTNGRLVVDQLLNGGRTLELSRAEGTSLGTPRQGVLAMAADGTVLSNTIGPVEVPAGGYALAYDPALRPLALLSRGRRVSVSVTLEPGGLEHSAWAVEAGPLLVQDGRAAFEPESEGFARGQRILDEPTQQAALGVRADGTVLFVVAETMVAEDLVPLFLELGAEAALRLDSGSSATLVAGGRTVNRLFTRRVESAIVAVPLSDVGAAR